MFPIQVFQSPSIHYRSAMATHRENLWNCSCQKLLAQFWNTFTVSLICWNSLKHGCQGCFHISLLFLGWSPFKCMTRVGLYSMHNFVATENIAKKKYKASFRKLLAHCKFRRNVRFSSNKFAQAGANHPKTKLELGLVFFQYDRKKSPCLKTVTAFNIIWPWFDP